MMLWDSLSIVRLRTQVTQSSPRPLAERTCVFGGRTLKYFLQRLCCHGNLWKNTGSILSIFSRLCHHWNLWDRSQVSCRSFRAPAFTLVSYRGTCDLRTPSQLSRFFPAPWTVRAEESFTCVTPFVSLFWLTADPLSHLLWTLPLTTMKTKEN